MGYFDARKRISLNLLIVFTVIGIFLFLGINSVFLPAASKDSAIQYQVIERSRSQIHTVTIPHDSNYSIMPAVSSLQPIQDFIAQEQSKVIAAINGGYFDPINQKTTSFIIHNSLIIADPRFNERLVDNPDLQQYLSQIFNRAEFRSYHCETKIQYDIQPHSATIPANCILMGSLGGGPSLLPKDASEAEAFIAYQNGQKIRDVIGSDSLNARSAIGITAAGDIILAVVAQQAEQPTNSGASLTELTNFLASMGAVKAMNLDGGSSTSLYYDGQVIYGKVDQDGNQVQRPIKSVLLVQENLLH